MEEDRGPVRVSRDVARAAAAALTLRAALVDERHRLVAAIRKNRVLATILEAGLKSAANQQQQRGQDGAGQFRRADADPLPAAPLANPVNCLSLFELSQNWIDVNRVEAVTRDNPPSTAPSTTTNGRPTNSREQTLALVAGGARATSSVIPLPLANAGLEISLTHEQLHLTANHFAQIIASNPSFAPLTSLVSTKRPVGSRPPGLWFAIPSGLLRTTPIGEGGIPSQFVAPGVVCPTSYSQSLDESDLQASTYAFEPPPEVPWSKQEISTLLNAIKTQALRFKTRDVLRQVQHDLSRGGASGRDAKMVMAEKMKAVRELSDAQLLASVPPSGGTIIDWDAISSEFAHPHTHPIQQTARAKGTTVRNALGGVREVVHSPAECQRRWAFFECPQTNTGAFSNEETRLLKDISLKWGNRNWEMIADDLRRATAPGSSDAPSLRTPFSLIVRRKESLVDRRVAPWTSPEIRTLELAIQLYGTTDWFRISTCLERKSGPHCFRRYHLGGTQGSWSENEDVRLAIAAIGYSTTSDSEDASSPVSSKIAWESVALHLHPRGNTLCRDRWQNRVASRLTPPNQFSNVAVVKNVRAFTYLQAQALKAAIDIAGRGNWTAISRLLAAGVAVDGHSEPTRVMVSDNVVKTGCDREIWTLPEPEESAPAEPSDCDLQQQDGGAEALPASRKRPGPVARQEPADAAPPSKKARTASAKAAAGRSKPKR